MDDVESLRNELSRIDAALGALQESPPQREWLFSLRSDAFEASR